MPQIQRPLIINDNNVQVAIESSADSVHIGQNDMDAKTVRRLIGKDKILGVSSQTVEQAVAAEEAGADYLGVGAVFNTSTKLDADTASLDNLKAICTNVSIPVVAKGGITKENLYELKGSGIAGAALVSGIFAQDDIEESCRELFKLFGILAL
jgi:thiamine-phosphate pyrophosphorylase